MCFFLSHTQSIYSKKISATYVYLHKNFMKKRNFHSIFNKKLDFFHFICAILKWKKLQINFKICLRFYFYRIWSFLTDISQKCPLVVCHGPIFVTLPRIVQFCLEQTQNDRNDLKFNKKECFCSFNFIKLFFSLKNEFSVLDNYKA